MSLYSKARRHIDMNRVKELREEKIKEKKIAEILREQQKICAEIECIQSKHIDWREELSEQMTSSDMFFATLPARGDVNLEDITATAIPGTDGAGGSGGNYSLGDYDQTGNGGFFIYLDSTKYDTIYFTANSGNADRIEISINSGSYQTLSNGTNAITISPENRKSNTLFLFNAFKSGGSGSSGATISGTAFQRRLPVNAFVGLDDPEASSFIRDGSMDNLSSAEKKKKLEDQLKSSEEYLNKMFGEGMPKTATTIAEYEPQQSFMDIQVGGERITKVGGKTVTDTTRGIEDGKMDGKPIYHDAQGNIRVGEKPQPTNQSQRIVRQYSFDDKLKGTWADPEFRSKQVADARAAAYDPNAPFAKGGAGDSEWMDQQAEIARANARGEVVKQLSKPVPKINTSNQAELERNIRTSLRQLEIDNKELESNRLKRNLAFAADLGLDILTFITILSPIPGDEAAALSVQASKQGIKTAAKSTVKNKVKKALADPNKAKKIQQAVDDGYMTLDDLLSSPLPPRPDKLPHSIPKGIKHNLRQSYNPQGKILTEKKKLKSPSDIVNKIPGYYDGKPSPLGFPVEPPPKTVNGYHPDLVDGKKVANRFNRLDPISAKAMPMTGNPHIDKKIKKARNKAK